MESSEKLELASFELLLVIHCVTLLERSLVEELASFLPLQLVEELEISLILE